MAFRKGDKVWVEDRDAAWVEGEVIDFRDRHVFVQTASRLKVSFLRGTLLLFRLTVFQRFFFPLVYLAFCCVAVHHQGEADAQGSRCRSRLGGGHDETHVSQRTRCSVQSFSTICA